jgi:hypothetical protein
MAFIQGGTNKYKCPDCGESYTWKSQGISSSISCPCGKSTSVWKEGWQYAVNAHDIRDMLQAGCETVDDAIDAARARMR